MKIYVSSTKADLGEHRSAIIGAIEELGHTCIAMEDYTADTRPPVEKCLHDVASCNLYLGIFAWRYGYVPPDHDTSITELEYRQALDRGIPTLIFLLDENVPWLPSFVDEGKRGERPIDRLREQLKQQKTVSFFTNASDIRAKASRAIKDAVDVSSRKPRVSLRLPQAGAAQFGRESEMRLLDSSWKSERTNVVTLVAFGGVGKSALINSWLARMASEDFRGARNVFGWSFYNQEGDNSEASANIFTAEALSWFGDPHPDLGALWEKGQRLAELVRKERTILILDGLEVLQHTRGSDEGKLKDQSLQALLQSLAWQNSGLCLIATRLPVVELEPFINNTVQEILLENLPAQDGVALLSSLGVHGTRAEMIEATQTFGGHALALTLLGSCLVEFYDGAVSRWREVNQPEPEPARRVMSSYERLLGQGPELDILQLLGLFSGPAHTGALSELRKPPLIPGLTESLINLPGQKWKAAIHRLRRLKLVAEQSESRDVLDTHPLVRQHFSEKLQTENEEAWKTANNRLYEYYKSLPTKELPDTLAEMAYLFQAVTHGCRAGRHQEAFNDVYWPRIRRGEDGYSVLTLGAYGADLVAISGFFDEYLDEPWDRPVEALDENSRAVVLTEASFDLRGLGRLEEAIATARAGLNMHRARNRSWAAANAAGNLSEMLVTFGDLIQATVNAELSIELADQSSPLRVTNIATLADVLHQRGQFELAEQKFLEAEALHRQLNPSVPYLHALRGYHFCDLLMGKGAFEEVVVRATHSLSVDKERPFAIALALLTLARVEMLKAIETKSQEFSEAWRLMSEGLSGLRLAGHQELAVRGLLAAAELARHMRQFEQCELTLKEAQAAVIRDQMRLHQADTYLQYALLNLATGDKEVGRNNFEKAKRHIEIMGYHRRGNELRELSLSLGT